MKCLNLNSYNFNHFGFFLTRENVVNAFPKSFLRQASCEYKWEVLPYLLDNNPKLKEVKTIKLNGLEYSFTVRKQGHRKYILAELL